MPIGPDWAPLWYERHPGFTQCPYSILQNEQPSTLFGRELQRAVRFPPIPALQVGLRQADQPFAEPRTGGDAVGAAVGLEPHRFDSLASDPRTEGEHRP